MAVIHIFIVIGEYNFAVFIMKKKLVTALLGICLLSGCGKMQEIPALQAEDPIYHQMVSLEIPQMTGGVREKDSVVFSDIGIDGLKQYLEIYSKEKKTEPIEIVDEEKIVVQVPIDETRKSLMYLVEQPELKSSSGKEAEAYDHAYLFSGFEAKINSHRKNLTYVTIPFHLLEDETLESSLDTVEIEKPYYVSYSMEIFRQFYEKYCKNYGIPYDSCVNMQGGQLEIKYPLIRSEEAVDINNLEKTRTTETLIMLFQQEDDRLKFTIKIQDAKPEAKK